MWEDRADRVRRDIAALAAAGLGVSELHTAAIQLVDHQVRTDLTCWATIDPETLVISTMVSGDTVIPAEYQPRLAEAEYSAGEPHTFAELALHKESVAKLSDLSAADRQRSTRFSQVWRPLGLGQEARVLFLIDGSCWGAAGLVRSGRDFDTRETDFLAAVAPAIAGATRLAVRHVAWPEGAVTPPAIVVIGGGGEPHSMTPGAHHWQEWLDDIAPGRFAVMMQVMAAGARTAKSGQFFARIRDARGRWAILQASPLIGTGADELAVVIESASGDQLLGLMLAAYGLSAREREICREVMAGHSTTDIADRLFISANTVQDHLKSVFAKVEVRSRGELVARLRSGAPITALPSAPASALGNDFASRPESR